MVSNLLCWTWKGPEPWLHLKDKEMEALRKGPDSQSQHSAFQRHRLHSAQLGELTLNASQGSLEKQTPQVPMWESLAFGKRP